MIVREDQNDIAVLRLDHGKANALDLELAEALADALERAAETSPAIVITGTGSIFSAGVDLFRVLDGGGVYIERFLPALNRCIVTLYELPRPTVAAVNGHAIAGGCILAAACDYRLMAEGKGRIGVPELLVGVPFPAAALNVLRSPLPPQHQREIILGGQTYAAADAAAKGLIDEVVPADELMRRAVARATRLGSIDRVNFAETKRALNDALRGDPSIAERDREVVARWSAPESLERIRKYLDATVGRKT